MNERVSLPIDLLEHRYDAVVVGSGYGAGIAACRLAEAGARVCVLERGRELRPGQYPDSFHEIASEAQFDTPKKHVGKPSGLFDFRVNDEINVFIGCGLGGTSLVNANVSIEPDRRVFDDSAWPAALRGDLARLDGGFQRAYTMLGARPLPEEFLILKKTSAHKASAEGMKRPFLTPRINVTFEDGLNAAGVEQQKCKMCGDCVTGCNHSGKNTVLMNYLPVARRNGAHIFTEVSVRWIEPSGSGWLVHFDLVGAGRERFEREPMFIRADLVFLGAGALGSTEILLRSQEHGLSLSRQLGKRFSGNGDVLGFAYNCDREINGIGFGGRQTPAGENVGPCITGLIDGRDPDKPLDKGLIIEEGSIPSGLSDALPTAFAFASKVVGSDTDRGLADRLAEVMRRLRAWLGRGDGGAVDQTQTFLVMTHDDAGGQMKLEDDRLRIHWPGCGSQPGIVQADQDLLAATRPLGGTYVKNPMWTRLLKRHLTTVHPLGGCAMGDDARSGVTNHKGQVFADGEGTRVYETLYVADGSVIPRSLGVNPLMTISAVAERCSEILVEDHGARWKRGGRAPLPPAPQTTAGIRFTETMVGYFSRGVKGAPRVDATSPSTQTAASYTDYWDAYEQGKRQRSDFKFVLTIIADDARGFIDDPAHAARMVGTVEADKIPDGPFTVLGGDFNLFVDDPADPQSKRMHYRMQFVSARGKVYYFEGFKDIRDDRGFDLWSDTTTLFVTIYDGPTNQDPIYGQGVLRIKPRDFLKQLTTMQPFGHGTVAQRTRAIVEFGGLFLGALADGYVHCLVDSRSRLRRFARGLALVPVVLALAVLWFMPWRPNLVRDQPPITAGEGPVHVPPDVKELGLFPQYLRGVDLRPGAYTIESAVLHVRWIPDNVVQDHGNLAPIPFVPADIQRLDDLPIKKGFINLAEIKDGSGQVVGIGSQVENITLDSRPLSHVINADTDWTMTFQGRGMLFLSQKEGGPDIGVRKAAAEESGKPWVGEAEFNHTLGPIPASGGPVNDARGIVHGGTGEFAGVVGVFKEYNILYQVPPVGDIDGATRFEITYIKPTHLHERPRAPETPPELAPAPALEPARAPPRRVRERELHFRWPADVVYLTHGESVHGPVIPESIGVRKSPALARVSNLMVKLRDRSGDVIGLAGASTVDDHAQWTISIPGEGAIHVVAREQAAGSGGILRGRAGVIQGGTGHFVSAAGTVIERAGAEPEVTTLSLRYVTD